MDELYQLKNLKNEIKEQEKRLKQLRAESTALSGASDGMPRGADAFDKVGGKVTEIVALEALIKEELTEYWRKYVELEMYISNIPDSFTRRIFRMRFIDGESWNAIAWKCGGKNTANGIRMRCERFVENN